MRVTLLGTGDSTGTPTVGCDCETCERAREPGDALRRRMRERGVETTRERGVERSRFSVHVRNDDTGETLLIDASPDFRQQLLTRDVALPDAAVITHVHFDHLDGLGNVYRTIDSLPVHAADETDPATGESVAETVAGDYDYLDRVTVHPQTTFEPFEVAGFEVTLVPVDHPPMLCYGLRVKEPETGAALSITGDSTFAIPARSKEALAGADLALVEGIVHAEFCEGHPAGGDHYDAAGVPRTFGSKHMTLTGSRAMARKLGVDDYRIVHTAHFVPPELAFADDIAVDGETFEL